MRRFAESWMNPVPQKPDARFLESAAFRRRSAMQDVWAARVITVGAAAVGLATFLLFVFLALEAGPWWPGEQASPRATDGLWLLPARAAGDPASPMPSRDPSTAPAHSGAPTFWWGSVKVTGIAMLVAVPLAIGAALHVSHGASRRNQARLRAVFDAFHGVPTVAVGCFALAVLTPLLRKFTGASFPLQASAVGVAVGLAIVPTVFSIAADALGEVPPSWVRSAWALGATRWEAVRHVVLPAAAPGLCAAMLIGMVQTLGETIIVMMVGGRVAAAVGLEDPMLTVPVAWAFERGGPHHRGLLLPGLLLVLLCLFLQGLAGWIRRRNAAQRREEGT
ncbi:MAG: hypothetical protein RIT19_1752 [Verrucomicrobiota bacterium]|jgi:phosphate transport system permease protein